MMKKIILFLVLGFAMGLSSCEKVVDDDQLIANIRGANQQNRTLYDPDFPMAIMDYMTNNYGASCFISSIQMATDLGFELYIRKTRADQMDQGKRFYFDLNGRKLVSTIKEKGASTQCFEFNYPIRVRLEDASILVVQNRNEMEQLKRAVQEGSSFEFVYPFEVLHEVGDGQFTPVVKIHDKTELESSYRRCDTGLETVFTIEG